MQKYLTELPIDLAPQNQINSKQINKKGGVSIKQTAPRIFHSVIFLSGSTQFAI